MGFGLCAAGWLATGALAGATAAVFVLCLPAAQTHWAAREKFNFQIQLAAPPDRVCARVRACVRVCACAPVRAYGPHHRHRHLPSEWHQCGSRAKLAGSLQWRNSRSPAVRIRLSRAARPQSAAPTPIGRPDRLRPKTPIEKYRAKMFKSTGGWRRHINEFRQTKQSYARSHWFHLVIFQLARTTAAQFSS